MVYLGLPIKNGGSFHGYVSHNQMVSFFGAMAWKHQLHAFFFG
jgi:hypothetical protein